MQILLSTITLRIRSTNQIIARQIFRQSSILHTLSLSLVFLTNIIFYNICSDEENITLGNSNKEMTSILPQVHLSAFNYQQYSSHLIYLWFNIQAQSINFMTLLLLDLEPNLVLFASSLNAESGPRFAEVWREGKS